MPDARHGADGHRAQLPGIVEPEPPGALPPTGHAVSQDAANRARLGMLGWATSRGGSPRSGPFVTTRVTLLRYSLPATTPLPLPVSVLPGAAPGALIPLACGAHAGSPCLCRAGWRTVALPTVTRRANLGHSPATGTREPTERNRGVDGHSRGKPQMQPVVNFVERTEPATRGNQIHRSHCS